MRFATFNASLNRGVGRTADDASREPDGRRPVPPAGEERRRGGSARSARRALINEFDPLGRRRGRSGPEDLFRDNFLEVSQNGAQPIEYPYAFIAPSNTGVADRQGSEQQRRRDARRARVRGRPFGFGAFPGQFGMVVYSRYPIEYDAVRTFQLFKWKDMPGNLIPTPFYSPDEVEILRLSSKSHWDVPILIGGKTVHFLVSHPTPPVFDGPEDRNGRRNHDEIRFWADYISPESRATSTTTTGGAVV